MERNELATREALRTSERQLALIKSRLPELAEESRSIKRRMQDLQTQSFGERVVRWFMRRLRLDGKHKELKALEARHQKLTDTIDRYLEQQMFLEVEYRSAMRKIRLKAELGRVADEALRDIQNQDIRESLKRDFLKALDEVS